jgi:hypothetical protein
MKIQKSLKLFALALIVSGITAIASGITVGVRSGVTTNAPAYNQAFAATVCAPNLHACNVYCKTNQCTPSYCQQACTRCMKGANATSSQVSQVCSGTSS